MTYSCREIIDLAKRLSQTQNSRAFDFMTEVHLLNNVYSQLYNDLATSQAFVNEFKFTSSVADLPKDCYKVISVSKNNKYFYINQSSNSYDIPGTYTIENGTIRINGEFDGEYLVKYYTMPEILTASGDVEYLKIAAELTYQPFLEYDPVTNEYCVIYKSGSTYYNYNIDTKEGQSIGTPTRPSRTFNNKPISFTFSNNILTQVLWNGEDVTEYFDKSEQGLHCEVISNDNEHIAATYTDDNGSMAFIYVFDTNWNSVEVNPFLYKGKYFPFKACDILTDDSTGKYLLIQDDQDNLAVTSYVPDTVLEFPENTFFDVLIDRLAIQFGSLNGLTNDGLQTKLTNDETAFYASINRSNQGIRIRNDMRVRNARF